MGKLVFSLLLKSKVKNFLNFWSKGQLVAHDMSKQAGGTVLKKHEKRCCTKDGKMLPQSSIHKSCYPIPVSKDDPVFSKVRLKDTIFCNIISDLCF